LRLGRIEVEDHFVEVKSLHKVSAFTKAISDSRLGQDDLRIVGPLLNLLT
jgi:hypothetical protein